jgi:very-short-patch-repair endonuclease
MRGKSQTRGSDAIVADMAERQHGVVARRQLIAVGLGEDAIDRRLRLERLHRLHPGVYTVGCKIVSRRGRWMAAVLASGPGAVLSHRSAAALWGIGRPGSGAIEITTPSKSRSRGSICRHFAALPADEVTKTQGIPVTTVPRVLFDMAAILPIDAVERAMRETEVQRLFDSLSLEDLLARHPRRRGARAIRECLRRRRDLPGGITRSDLESRFVAFLDRFGLPRPRLNAHVQVRDRRYEIDCLWVGLRLGVELDGFEAHGTHSAFEGDRQRDRLLQVAGYRTTRVTWRQLHDEPETIAADLRALIASQSAQYKRA